MVSRQIKGLPAPCNESNLPSPLSLQKKTCQPYQLITWNRAASLRGFIESILLVDNPATAKHDALNLISPCLSQYFLLFYPKHEMKLCLHLLLTQLSHEYK